MWIPRRGTPQGCGMMLQCCHTGTQKAWNLGAGLGAIWRISRAGRRRLQGPVGVGLRTSIRAASVETDQRHAARIDWLGTAHAAQACHSLLHGPEVNAAQHPAQSVASRGGAGGHYSNAMYLTVVPALHRRGSHAASPGPGLVGGPLPLGRTGGFCGAWRIQTGLPASQFGSLARSVCGCGCGLRAMRPLWLGAASCIPVHGLAAL